MTYSPRNPGLFSPRNALVEVISQVTGSAMAHEVADLLLKGQDDRQYPVYTTPEMPRGFKVLVTIQPEKNALILKGLELVDGHRYNIVARVRAYRMEDKTQKFLGWTFKDSMRWGSAGFVKIKNGMAGPSRMWRETDIVSIEEAPDGA